MINGTMKKIQTAETTIGQNCPGPSNYEEVQKYIKKFRQVKTTESKNAHLNDNIMNTGGYYKVRRVVTFRGMHGDMIGFQASESVDIDMDNDYKGFNVTIIP